MSLGCWIDQKFIRCGGYDYPLDCEGEIITELAKPTGTATSDDKAAVAANSTGNGKWPGKGRGIGKGPGKGRGKGKWTAKHPMTLKSNGNCTSTCNSVVTEGLEVDENNSVVTERGADENSVVTEDPEAGVEISIDEQRKQIRGLTEKVHECNYALELARKELAEAVTTHKQTKSMLAAAFTRLEDKIKATAEVNRFRSMVIDNVIAINNPEAVPRLITMLAEDKRTRITGKQPQALHPPPGLALY